MNMIKLTQYVTIFILTSPEFVGFFLPLILMKLNKCTPQDQRSAYEVHKKNSSLRI